jgi:hypothetical protein
MDVDIGHDCYVVVRPGLKESPGSWMYMRSLAATMAFYIISIIPMVTGRFYGSMAGHPCVDIRQSRHLLSASRHSDTVRIHYDWRRYWSVPDGCDLVWSMSSATYLHWVYYYIALSACHAPTVLLVVYMWLRAEAIFQYALGAYVAVAICIFFCGNFFIRGIFPPLSLLVFYPLLALIHLFLYIAAAIWFFIVGSQWGSRKLGEDMKANDVGNINWVACGRSACRAMCNDFWRRCRCCRRHNKSH